jgi:hypothetical protein
MWCGVVWCGLKRRGRQTPFVKALKTNICIALHTAHNIDLDTLLLDYTALHCTVVVRRISGHYLSDL